MAHTIGRRTLVKVGRYTKEYIEVTFIGTSSTPATLDTRVNVPLYGRNYTNQDQATILQLDSPVIISNGQVSISNRSGALLNGNTIVIEITGY